MEPKSNQGKTARAGFSARTTIGVLIDSVDEDFQRDIWAGLESAAKEAGVNLVNFLGGDLNPADPATLPRNAIFELITPASIQGLIVASTVMATFVGNEQLDEHCKRYRPLPMVSVGFPLASMPSVICDSQLGLKDLVEHLIDRHARKRFMFLGGNTNNADSVERERIFHETLAERGIAVDPRLVCRADFRPDRAYALVRQAHDQGIPFDAVVCANDEMAIAAIDALDDVGIRIPEDVSITGFDDILSAGRLSLPLTTVRQPTYEISRRAMQVLLGLLKGEQPPPVERHTTQVVIRRSCGCFSETVQRAGEVRPRPRRGLGLGAPSPVPNLGEVILAALRKEDLASLGPLGRECLETLVQAFVGEVGGAAAAGSFLGKLDTSLRANFAQELADDIWDDFLTVLRRETGGRVSPGDDARAETLLHQARVLVKEAARQQQWKAHAHLTRQTRRLQYAIDYLVGSFDVPTLLDMMARELPRIGIRRCYLAVHAARTHAWEEARLLFAYDQSGRKPIPAEGIAYPAARLLPDGIVDRNDRVSLIWQPLVFENEEIGFVALDLNPREEISSFALASQIRSALKASMMMQEAREKDRRLGSLDRMKGAFLDGVTREVQALVGAVRDSSRRAMDAGEAEARASAAASYEASLGLQVALGRLRDVARMEDGALELKVRQLRPRRLLSELAASYRPVLTAAGVALQEDYPPMEVDDLFTDRDRVEQILDELVSSAVRLAGPEDRAVRLSLADQGDAVQLAVDAGGEGLPLERAAALLDGAGQEGAGGGLAFARQLAGYLRGSLGAEPAGPGRGARLVLTLKKGKGVLGAEEAAEEAGDAARAAARREELRRILGATLRARGDGVAQG